MATWHAAKDPLLGSDVQSLASFSGRLDEAGANLGSSLRPQSHEVDDLWTLALTKAGKTVGEKLWRFPLAAEYDKLLDSQIADMKNVGPRYGGSITAAQFLQRFIENDTPWAHLDIAGMVWADKPGATWDKGATGYGVRLLDRLVRDTLNG